MGFTTTSPVMRPELFQGRGGFAAADQKVMTVGGAVNATGILLSLCVASAVGSWMLVSAQPTLGFVGALAGLLVGVVASLVMWFKPNAAPVCAPVYALAQGLAIGAVSFIYAAEAVGTKVGGVTGSGIIVSASIGTFAVLGAMLALYKAGFIRATEKFRAVMLVVGLAIVGFSLVTMVLAMVGMAPAFLFSGPVAIGITAVILIWAAFKLILNFDFIEHGAASGAPKYMEWYAGYGLLSTLILIYLELLRLLSLLSKRN